MPSLFAAIVLPLALLGAGPVGQPDVFNAATLVPDDVTFFLHVNDAATVAGELADRPIARAGLRLVERGLLHEAWSRFSRASDDRGADLLRSCLGTDLTVASRSRAGIAEWVVITRLGPDQAARLLERLEARVVGSRRGLSLFEAPLQSLVLAKQKGTVVIGPREHRGLFDEVLPRLVGGQSSSLADHASLQSARRRLDGRTLGVFIRHDLPLGGWSAVALTLEGDRVCGRVASSFAHTPFQRPRTQIAWDAAPLRAFESSALAAFGEPTDVGDSGVDQAINAAVGRKLIDGALLLHVADRRFVVVGEQEMRQSERRDDFLAPTFTVCVEVDDPRSARAALDRSMHGFIRRLNEFGRDLFSIEPPAGIGSGPRCADVSPAVGLFFVDTPLMGDVSLNWTIVEGPQGGFAIIASHRQPLDEAVQAIQSIPATDDAAAAKKLDSVGTFNGVRLAQMLTSWGDQADRLAQPGSEEELRQTLRLLSSFAGGVERCCWKLARPSDRDVDLDLEIRLSPPESSRPD